MSTNDTNQQNCSGRIESAEQITADLVDAMDVPDAVADQFTDLVGCMADEISELRDENDELQDRVDDAEAEVERLNGKLDDVNGSIEGVHNRISSVEDKAEQSVPDDPETVPKDSPAVQPDTALEKVVLWDDEDAERELTSNQYRARFVAKDVTDYARKCPAGRTINSGDVSTILQSGTDAQGRTQTVARVMQFIADLGGDRVELVKQRGTKRLVFSEGYAEQLADLSNGTDNTVVMGDTGEAVI